MPRLWRPAKSLPPAKPEKPLSGLRIALDPGHLGGKWAKMEERWFQVGDSAPVQEGDLTFRVARLLGPAITRTRSKSFICSKQQRTGYGETSGRFSGVARQILIKNGIPRPRADVIDPDDPEKEQTIRWQSEILFYRYSEIRRRAALVNYQVASGSCRLSAFQCRRMGRSESADIARHESSSSAGEWFVFPGRNSNLTMSVLR